MARTRFRRFNPWFLVVAAAGAMLLLLVLPGPDRGALEKRLARLREEAASRKLPRTVFGGAMIPGNAWEEYNLAMDDVLKLTDDPNGSILGEFASGQADEANAAIARRLAAEHGGLLDHLRLGARRENGQYPYQWAHGGAMQVPSLLASRKLANLAATQVRVLAEQGHSRQAIALALDLSVFARDVSANGTILTNLIGVAVYTTDADALRNVIRSGKLTPQELAELARNLETVDQDMPDLSAAFANQTMSIGTSIMDGFDPVSMSSPDASIAEWIGLMATGGWRYGFSRRRIAEDFLDHSEVLLTRIQKLGHMDFPDAAKDADAMETDMNASPNPVIRMSATSFRRTMQVNRETLAHLRLLRAAAIWNATGKMPMIADPFGTYLKSKEAGGHITIWSLGADGADNSGKGKWDADRAPGADIVLEVSKPPARP